MNILLNINLLSQNLLLVLSIVLSSLVFYSLSKLVVVKKTKQTPPKKQKIIDYIYRFKWLAIIFVASLVLAWVLQTIFALYSDSSLPAMLIVMLWPATLTITTLAIIIITKINRFKIGIICLLGGVLFSALLINNYYRFYPTVGQLFDKNNVQPINLPKGIMVQFNPSTDNNNRTSIETFLTSIASRPTAGKVYSLAIPGKVSHFKARSAFVYEPAIYTNATKINLPVVVLMPGFPGLPENWLGAGLETVMDNFAQSHDGITPLVFMVDNTGSLTNDTECVDSSRGNVETYLSVDVPDYIKSHFSVESNASHWAIGGLSMGGTCSIMIALRHSNVYHYFLDFGGEIGPEVGNQSKTIKLLFNGSESLWQQHQPLYLLSHNHYAGMGGFFVSGKEDSQSITNATIQLSSAAQKAGIETIYELINGQHTFNVWQQAFKLSLPWISNRLGATNCDTECL